MTKDQEWTGAGGVGPVSEYFMGSAEIARRIARASLDLGSSALDLMQERFERSDARIAERSQQKEIVK
jgi:hypothetical protein